MSPRRLLAWFVLALIITVVIAALTQVPEATTSGSNSSPTVLANEAIIEMAAAKLPEEIIITKIRASKRKFDLPTPELVELNNGGVSANVVKAMMTPKNAPHDAGVKLL